MVNIAVQRCTATKFGPLQSDPIKAAAGAARPEESIDEQRQKTIPDRGHSRRWYRQGSGAGRAAGAGGGGKKAWRRRAFRPFRFRILGLLRKARPDDAGRLEEPDRQA